MQNGIGDHNRFRERDFLEILAQGGFEVVERRHEVDPVSLRALQHLRVDARFRRFSHEELAVTGCELILRPAAAAIPA